jgi:signal transduction histidine kinase
MVLMMSYGLPRKLRIVFIVQVALVTLAIVAGGWLVGVLAKHGLFRELLREDAAYYWQRYRENPATPPPDTRRIRGLRVAAERIGQAGSTGLLPLNGLAPGFHDLERDGWLVWVDDGPGGRLYLLYNRQHAQQLIWWVASVPLLLTLLAIYLASWYAYRASRDLIIPINELARRVANWDPRLTSADDLDPADLGPRFKGETRQLAQVLHEMARRMRAHIQREHEFTRDASHELRTPLTVIRVATDVALGDPDISPRQQRSLQRIARAGADMEEVIESQLLLARESEIGVPLQQVDVAQLVADEVAKAEEKLQQRPIRLHLEVQQVPRLETSAGALRVVVRHLLENACKYTDQGDIFLRLENNRLVVTDTGIGMNSDDLRLAFEPFYRVNHAMATGAGLGLSIVRRLCDRFGWSIRLESQPGQGTCATLSFAAEPQPPAVT